MIFEVLFPIVTTVLFSSKGSNSGDDSSRALIIPYEVWPILPVYLAAIDGSLIVLELNNLIDSFDKSGGPYLLVTHYVNILAFTGLSTLSGGMVAFDLNSQQSIHIKLND